MGPFGFGLPLRFAVFCLNFGAFGFGLPLRFTGFWQEITRRLLAEVQHFACRSYEASRITNIMVPLRGLKGFYGGV